MKKHVKEIWLKFGCQEEYFQNEERLLVLLDTAPGDCTVRVYDASAKRYKTLREYSFDEKQLSLLTDFLGKDNAKYQEREIETQKNPEKKIPNIVQIIPCNHDMYAVFGDVEGEKYKSKVLMFALCDNGEIYPLHFDSWLGICSLFDTVYDAPNYELENGEIWQGETE